jgi:aspartyl-tRNA(Asn)/glutamyl-tRNA(Gln) amidotransferase subunit A
VTRNVRDNAFLYSIISGRDENDSTTVETPKVELPEPGDLKGIRIGLPRQLNEAEGIEPGVKAAVEAALAEASALGAEIESCELPLSVEYGLPCYYLIAPAEASANLSRYDGVRYGLRSKGADFREMVMNTRHDGLGDEPKRRIMLGTYALSSGYYDAYYGKAQRVRTVIKREHDSLFERYDVLVSPTCATTAFPIGEKAADPLAMYLTDLLTIPSNMAGMPGLSIPCGLSDGLPVGLQLIGPQFSENVLYRVAAALEAQIGFDPVPERLR